MSASMEHVCARDVKIFTRKNKESRQRKREQREV
jgi:hypothetical protein